jgi:2-methylcitrate dehydratase PrpD
LTIGANSWAREYHAGNAALCAVNAAQAASQGHTVNEDMLEARRGFFEVFGGVKAALNRETGPDWDIVKYLAIKLAPGAHAPEATAEAAAIAARQANASPDQISKILVSGPGSRDQTVSGSARPPKDMVEAIHSVAYFVASAVVDKDFSWVHATPEKIHRPVVARLISLVEPDPAPPPVDYDWSWGGAVAIVAKSGARFTGAVDAPRGALLPESGVPAQRIEEILKQIHEFDRVKQAAEFTRLLH